MSPACRPCWRIGEEIFLRTSHLSLMRSRRISCSPQARSRGCLKCEHLWARRQGREMHLLTPLRASGTRSLIKPLRDRPSFRSCDLSTPDYMSHYPPRWSLEVVNLLLASRQVPKTTLFHIVLQHRTVFSVPSNLLPHPTTSTSLVTSRTVGRPAESMMTLKPLDLI